MGKKKLEKRIEELEKRVRELESPPPVYVPFYTPTVTPNTYYPEQQPVIVDHGGLCACPLCCSGTICWTP